MSAAVWHEVENGSYRADLPLWRELAARAEGAILDLGAGSGRVALDLAAHGHELVALDEDAGLLAVLRERAAADGRAAPTHRAAPALRTVVADARSFALDRRFALVLAPMQLAQILGGPAARAAMLRCVREHLLPHGVFAAALADPHAAIPRETAQPPLPDMLERDGWVFSSQPVSVTEGAGQVVIERVRQSVAPDGSLAEERARIGLDVVSADELEAQARAAGLDAAGRRSIPETSDHIGSEVVLCRRP